MYELDRLEKMTAQAECSISSVSVLVSLKIQRVQLEKRLKYVNKAIEAFEANPGAAELLEALRSVENY